MSTTGESWEEIGHRMKHRLQRALDVHPIPDWSDTINMRKSKIVSSMNELPFWTKSACEWDPIECSSAIFYIASRFRGRPFTRWHNS